MQNVIFIDRYLQKMILETDGTFSCVVQGAVWKGDCVQFDGTDAPPLDKPVGRDATRSAKWTQKDVRNPWASRKALWKLVKDAVGTPVVVSRDSDGGVVVRTQNVDAAKAAGSEFSNVRYVTP